jgi:glycosyltransferase involved in cell wall biosynthesis
MTEIDSNSAKQTKVGLYSDNKLRFFGGGEVIIMDIGNFLTDSGLDTIVSDDINSKDINRIDLKVLNHYLRCNYVPTNYVEIGVIKSFYHPMPNLSELEKRDVNLISIRRIPSLDYLKSVNKISSEIVFTCHGIGIEKRMPINILIILYQLYLRIIIRRIAKTVNNSTNLYFIVLTETTKKIFNRQGINDSKLKVINNGLLSLPYGIGRNDEVFRVLFIGRIEKNQKGIKLLKSVVLKVKHLIPEIEFIILGTGPDEHILKNFQAKEIQFLGFVSDEEKIRELKNSNLLLITSNIDPFPLVCIEGLFSGLPIVTTPLIGTTEMLKSVDDAGRVNSFNSSDLVYSIIEYYNEWRVNKEEYYQRKISRSIASKEKFSFERMTNSYLKYIQQLASGKCDS